MENLVEIDWMRESHYVVDRASGNTYHPIKEDKSGQLQMLSTLLTSQILNVAPVVTDGEWFYSQKLYEDQIPQGSMVHMNTNVWLWQLIFSDYDHVFSRVEDPNITVRPDHSGYYLFDFDLVQFKKNNPLTTDQKADIEMREVQLDLYGGVDLHFADYVINQMILRFGGEQGRLDFEYICHLCGNIELFDQQDHTSYPLVDLYNGFIERLIMIRDYLATRIQAWEIPVSIHDSPQAYPSNTY